ncbi:hypothetical protein ACVWYQ_007856 [Bradyrhizobium sp. USDA 3397]
MARGERLGWRYCPHSAGQRSLILGCRKAMVRKVELAPFAPILGPIGHKRE